MEAILEDKVRKGLTEDMTLSWDQKDVEEPAMGNIPAGELFECRAFISGRPGFGLRKASIARA